MNGMELVFSYLIAVALGALGGYFLSNARHRRDGDGKTVKEWRAEYGDYKQSVNEHFQRSAELFQGLTDQYRQVYSHLAEGAVTLCRDSSDDPRIEALRTGLLTGGVATSAAQAVQDEKAAGSEAVDSATDADGEADEAAMASGESGESGAQGDTADTTARDEQDDSASAEAGDATEDSDEKAAADATDGPAPADDKAGADSDERDAEPDELEIPSFTALNKEGEDGSDSPDQEAADADATDDTTRETSSDQTRSAA